MIMAKRFTDSRKWDDPFFVELPNKYKLLWYFILDKCNHAGIFEFSKRLVDFNLNDSYTKNEILEVFNGRIEVLKSGKWFIKKFICYQYGELSEANRAHNSVINILQKEGAYKGLISPIQGYKDKDKDKDKDIIKRMSEFKKEISAFDYPDELKSDFFDYWSELNKSKTKMRFQLQKTWNLNLRLKRWAGNDFGKKGSNFDYKSLLSVSHKDIQKYEKN